MVGDVVSFVVGQKGYCRSYIFGLNLVGKWVEFIEAGFGCFGVFVFCNEVFYQLGFYYIWCNGIYLNIEGCVFYGGIFGELY